MPYRVENPQPNVVVAKLSGVLSLEEIRSLNKEVVTQYANQRLYIIYEVSDLQRFPTNIPSLKQASEPIATNKYVGMQIVTGVKSPVFNFLFEVIGQLFKQSLRKTNSVEEALAILAEIRSKT